MPKSKRAAKKVAATPEAKLLAITLDADTARVVHIEGLDASGARHELSRAEREVLLQRATDGRLEDLVERAFEAGIACVLDDGERNAGTESAEDAELRHELLAPLIKRSAVRHLTEGAVLDRVVLSTLIDHSSNETRVDR
jgi:hypothetical protein